MCTKTVLLVYPLLALLVSALNLRQLQLPVHVARTMLYLTQLFPPPRLLVPVNIHL